MLWKLGVAIAAAVAASFVPALSAYWFWILVLGVVILLLLSLFAVVYRRASGAFTARSSPA